uniref:Uncharacterized protein n=1 Tax=Anopheles funestus TaxID=62324 RepID=A0A182RAS5_ANOFN
MQWKLNLIESSTKNKCLKKDPYDIAYMRAEDKEQQKGVPKYTGFTKRASNAKSFANGKSPERMQSSTPTQSVGAKSGAMQTKQQQWMPKYSVTMKRGSNMKSAPNVELPRRMESSTPTKSGRSKVLDNLDMDKVDLSSIGNISNDDIDGYISNDSEKSDATYVPYAMLSKTETRGRGNQKGRKRQSKVPARVPPKRSRVNIKAANKNSRGTGRETSAMCGNELKRNGLNCEPSTESTMQVDNVAMNDSSCQTLDSTPSKIPNRGQNVQPKSKFLCKRLNAKQTTTQTTTHVTTTQTTEVGIGSRTETGNRPTAETAVQEDVHMALPTETMAAHATQKIYKTLLKVEEHKEYRIECEVKEKECEAYILSQGDRAHILSHVNKIVELLNQPR